MDLLQFLQAVSDPTKQQPNSVVSILTMVIPLILMVGVFYFLLIRPEKKRTKQMRSMLDNIQIADEVVTSGGIIGRVLSIKEDTILIETGSDRTKIRILKSSIAENRTVHEVVEEVKTPKVEKAPKAEKTPKIETTEDTVNTVNTDDTVKH